MITKLNLANQSTFDRFLQAFTEIPFNKMLGLKLEHFDTESVTMRFNMKNELIGNFLHGILHGGVISSVLDMAGGVIVMTSAIHRHPEASANELAAILGKTSTVDLQISYLRPGKGETFIAKAWLTKSGNKISFTRMELHNQNDELIATGNGTYLTG
ncbi:thioesterase family protein [Aquicella lusitana]|uniref:Uncharacterized protein (TIGR00369 family) n=1 Tax=Aquicella lusitana TaxID=254246 RepID=A0A370G8T0_9COXI|nr:thioesterase family protein [Aquicella lusitana]RDI40202.1 uncharacterized protein (TIGR00369 family) [Aquicella lusitana]VVC72407.1 hypothetical protein AQULUS_01170 [Aquicella lusitana]